MVHTTKRGAGEHDVLTAVRLPSRSNVGVAETRVTMPCSSKGASAGPKSWRCYEQGGGGEPGVTCAMGSGRAELTRLISRRANQNWY